MNDIPATGDFLALGLGVILIVLGGFVASLYLRFRNLAKDEALIEQLADED